MKTLLFNLLMYGVRIVSVFKKVEKPNTALWKAYVSDKEKRRQMGRVCN